MSMQQNPGRPTTNLAVCVSPGSYNYRLAREVRSGKRQTPTPEAGNWHWRKHFAGGK